MTDIASIQTHFQDKESQVRAIYNCLISRLREFGPVSESPRQTSIHLDRMSGFAGVNTRKSYLLLNFRTDYKVENPRIIKLERHSARRFMHTVKLQSEADVDDELLGWLRDAYEIAG
jgi:hypothetical protein